MPYTIKQITKETYELIDGSKTVGTLRVMSDNDALFQMIHGGKRVGTLPADFQKTISEGTVSEEEVDEVLNKGYSPCYCDACPPQKAAGCEYHKAE